MPSITVVLSTYNGAKHLAKQLDSIFSQQGVDVVCYMRDDGSKDGTVGIAREYSKTHNLIIDEGVNIGHQRSFMQALRDAPKGDYYAFADQDDMWFPEKLKCAVEMLQQWREEGPLMYHSNRLSVDENLKPFRHQMKRVARPLTRESALTQEFAQGCTIVMNPAARELVCRYLPEKKYYHDYWCGMINYMFGTIIYDERPQMYHISHGENSSTEGHLMKSWTSRLKMFFTRNIVYNNPTKDLLKGYGDLLVESDRKFLQNVEIYKNDIRAKLYLIFSPSFIRESLLGTLSLKIAVLLNKL